MLAALSLSLLLVGAADEGPTRGSPEEELRFGVDVAQRGLWEEARFRFERAVALAPEDARALNNLAVALEQQGEFDKAREAYEKALEFKPGDLYIQQNYDLFREADDKRNRQKKRRERTK